MEDAAKRIGEGGKGKEEKEKSRFGKRMAVGLVATWIAGGAAMGFNTKEAEAFHGREGGMETVCSIIDGPHCRIYEAGKRRAEQERRQQERIYRQQPRTQQMDGRRWEQAKENARREKDRWEQEVQKKEKTGKPPTVEMLNEDIRYVLKIWGMWQGDYECKQYPPGQKEIVVSRYYQPDFAEGFIEQCRQIIQSRERKQQQGGQGQRSEFQEREGPPPWQR